MKKTKEYWTAHIITLFPEMFPGPLEYSIIGKALKEKIWSLKLVNLQNFSKEGPKYIDDKPYGGGPGMIIKSEIVHKALKKITKKIKNNYSLVYLTPKGNKLNQKKIKKFIIQSIEHGYKKILVVTGKGLRSKVYNDPYRSEGMNVLKNSIPEYLKNDYDLTDKIIKITKADLKNGGDGAIYVHLKQKGAIIE